MDKATKQLRAQLRGKLSKWKDEEVPRLLAEIGEEFAKELDAADQLDAFLASSNRRASLGHRCLVRLAEDDGIGILASQLGENLPLKRNVVSYIGEEGSETWVVSRPGLAAPPPQYIRNMATLLDIMANHIIPEWIEYLDTAAPSADGLIPDARAFLKAMLALNLHDGTRAGQEEIWARVADLGHAVEGRSNRDAAVGILKDRKLIESKPGTGTILTTAGLNLARSLSSRSNPE